MPEIDEGPMQGNSDWIEFYDLDPKLLSDCIPECDTTNCGIDADYWVTTTCCNNAVWYCTDDLQKIYKSIIRMGQNDEWITCDFCNKRVPARGSLSKPHRF